jgi:hypothetical protein
MTPLEVLFVFYMIFNLLAQAIARKAQKVVQGDLAKRVKELEEKQETQDEYIQMLAGVRKPAQLESSEEGNK